MSTKQDRGSLVKRRLVGRKVLLARVLIVGVLIGLVSAAELVRQPARAAAVIAAMQGDGLTAEGVVLDFDEPPYKKGDVISLVRIFREDGTTPATVSDADKCPSRHLHGTIKIKNCKTGVLDGPFTDPFAKDPVNECGHGKVVPYRADVSIAVTGRTTAAVGDTVTYTVTLTNNGPHTADTIDTLPSGTFNGESMDSTSFQITTEGFDSDRFAGFFPIHGLPANSSRTVKFSLKITDDKFIKEGTLAVTFGTLTVAGCSAAFSSDGVAIDPVPSNNRASMTTEFRRIDVGPLPDMSKEFDIQIAPTPATGPVVIKTNLDSADPSRDIWLEIHSFLSFFTFSDHTGYGLTPGQAMRVQAGVRVVNGRIVDVNNDGNPDIVLEGSNGELDTFLAPNLDGLSIFSSGDGNHAVDIANLDIASNPSVLRISSVSAAAQGDAVAPAAQTGILSLLKGDKTGAFQKLSTIPLPGVPSAIVTGDFNGDQKTDAAVTLLGDTDGSPGSVLLFLGDGAGNFTAGGTFTAGVKPSAIAVGDFNNDNNLDLAVANHDSNDVSIFLGNGAGGFTLAATVPVGTNPVAIVAGDFNGNGKLDLATANEGSNNVTILLGGGNGQFVTNNVAAGQKPSSLVAADFNRDGKLDLAVANSGSGDIMILLNGAMPVTRATISNVEISGKKLIVTGTGFASGARILLDGQAQKKVRNDDQNPTTTLIAKKAANNIAPGQTVIVQVDSDGKFSEGFIFKRATQ